MADTWVFTQGESNAGLELRPEPHTAFTWTRGGQSFRMSFPRQAVSEVALFVRYVRGVGVAISLVETEHGAPPDSGRRLWRTTVPAAGVADDDWIEVSLPAPVPVRADHAYAIVVAPIGETVVSLGSSPAGIPTRRAAPGSRGRPRGCPRRETSPSA